MALDTIPKQEGGKLKAVASGTLPSGQPVVVNADGTVSVVAEAGVSQAVGSNAVFESAATSTISAVYDAGSNKVVVVFVDDADTPTSPKGKAVVGTVSGTSISFGATATWHADSTNFVDAVYHAAAQKVVIVYYDGDNSGYGTSVVGTVSGTTISFGSTVVFNSANTSYPFLAYDSSAEKVVVAYRTTSDVGQAQVGTVTGTSISWGTAGTYNSGATGASISCTYDSNADRIVVAYQDQDNSSYGTAAVGTVSGTSISFGSEAVFESATTSNLSIAYDSASQKVVIAYRDGGNSNYGTAIVGTVSASSISFGSAQVFKTANVVQSDLTENPTAGFVNLFYRDTTQSASARFITATVSGTSLTFSSETTLSTGDSSHLNGAFDSTSDKVVFVYQDKANSDYGTAVVVQNAYTSTTLTSENYIGMSGGVVAVDSQTEDIGSAVVFNNTGNTTKPHLCFDTNSNKTVIGFIDNAVSEKGTAIVGTVSGTSISFGSETVYETSVTDFPAMVYDSSNNKVIVAYQDEGNTDYGTVAVGTVSGTSISFGTPVVFESAAVQHVALAFDSNSNKVVVSYSDHGNSEHGTAIVGTVSGTSISFGSAAVFESAQTARVSSTFDSSNNKVVIAYRTTTGKAVVATVSGTSISFGTPVEFYNALTDELDIIFDSNADKVVIGYQSSGSDAGLAKVGTVSGTSISFGAEATFESANVASISPVFDSNINKVVLAYSDVGNSRYGTYAVGTISGTDITFGTPSVFASVDTRSQVGAVFDTTSNKVVLAYRDDSNSSYGTSVVMVPGYTDITRGQVASGGAATVDIVGTVSTNQSSLTAGQQYFVQTDGTLGLTAADPSVLAGTAISATKLIVKT
jgi:hypothetical protein